jgi:hypothetical protein
MPMGSVFISYRRDESRDACQALAGALMARLGKRNVFLDVDSIAGGELFPVRLEQALRGSDVVLVVIGPRWLIAADDRGLRRLDNPADFVRREVELALQSRATVLPLLVHGATLPRAADLPATLQPLAALPPLALGDAPAARRIPTGASRPSIVPCSKPSCAGCRASPRRCCSPSPLPISSSPSPTSPTKRWATTGSGRARAR